MTTPFSTVPTQLCHTARLLALVCAVAILAIVGGIGQASAQPRRDSYIGTLDTHPGARSPVMQEAWRIYGDYRATQMRIAAIQWRVADLSGLIQDTLQPAWIEGAMTAALGTLPQDLRGLRAELEREQAHARDLLAQWEARDLVYGDFFLGPLENAMLPLTVRHGPNGEYTAQLDPIHIGLIRWDQAIAAARQSGGPTSLDGRWHLSQNNGRYLAELIVSGGGGSILFYGLEREPIEGVSYSTSTGRVSFYRSRYPQTFIGTLTQDDEGHITVQGEWTAPDGNRGDWSAQYEGPAQ